MKIKAKKLSEEAILPKRMKEGDAGLDLFSNEETIIKKGELRLISTGIAIEIPKGYFGLIKDRSGLAVKNGLHCLAGVIDENYRGEIKIAIKNLGEEDFKVEKGMRIAQLLIIPYLKEEIEEVEKLGESERGDKGFGSSGIK